jgi:MscS family membrane protein
VYHGSRRLLWALLLALAWVASPALAQSDFGAINDPFPLRAADTSSPRDTLRSFITSLNETLEAWHANKPVAYIDRPFSRAAETLDFSELPNWSRRWSIATKMVLLKEILDRVELPSYDRIPGDEEVAEENLTRWTLPNTKIEIVKMTEGPRSGQFLFSRETVAQLKNYYNMARDLPYKKGASVNLYHEIRYSPGIWLPKTLPDALPAWMKWIVFGHGIWQWMALIVVLIISALIIGWLYRLGVWWDRRQKSAWRQWGTPIALLGALLIADAVLAIAARGIGLFDLPHQILSLVVRFIQMLSLAWLVLIIAGRLADGFAQRSAGPVEKHRFDAALMRVLFRLVSLLILVYLGVYAMDYVGIPIAPLIAGLGVSGLAIALAVRPTLENIVGGLTLFGDRPVRVGDFCAYGDKIGTVEAIGLRSTRIRSLDRTLVSVPNAEFSQMQLINYTSRDMMLYRFTLGLRYETTPDQLRYVLAKVREMLLGHPRVSPDPARVRFLEFGAYSLDLEIFAYVNSQDWGQYLGIREDLNLRIMDIVAEAGTGFAFPSQTAYLAKDAGLDAQRGEDAANQVGFWRARGKLPFPEFEEEERGRLENLLDYPPKGSPDYHPRV